MYHMKAASALETLADAPLEHENPLKWTEVFEAIEDPHLDETSSLLGLVGRRDRPSH